MLIMQITREELTIVLNKVLTQKTDKFDLDVIELTDFIIEFFYDRKSVDDRCLGSHDRDAFYKLDEVGIVSSIHRSADSPSLNNCKRSWILRSYLIIKLLNGSSECNEPENNEFVDLYSSLPSDVWEKD